MSTLTTEQALEFAAGQVRRLVSEYPDRMPTYTSGGRWMHERDRWAPDWGGGFLTGMMWIFARRSGDDWWVEQARRYCRALEPRKLDQGTHDIGFLFDPSWGRWLSGDGGDRAREVMITAGRTMAARFQAPGGYLCTWVDPGSTFIDVMMNVGVIFRAAELAGDERLRDVALAHCCTSQRFLVRGDGSTAHEGWFDTATGEFLRTATHQGYRADSTWARGQTWAIYGFTVAYRHSGVIEFLDTARRTADYYIDRTGAAGVPPNDWLDPAPGLPWESSAAAIAAAGMLHLAAALGPKDGARYRTYALALLARLCSTEFIAADLPEWEGILRHAAYHTRNRIGVDESVMWGDHYFVEALDMVAPG